MKTTIIRTTAIVGALLAFLGASAQVSAQPPALDTAYANVFDSPTSGDCGGGYCFGSGWGIPDLKATVAGNTNTLQPNFNTYNDNPGNAYWLNNGGAGPLGNKTFEGNLYYEQVVPLGATTMEFNGTVDAFTLDPGYTAVAFVTVRPGGAPLAAPTQALTATGAFSISLDISAFAGETIQAGFRMTGLNANPADEGALGSVVTTVAQLEAVIPPPPPPANVTPVPVLPFWGILGLIGLVGFLGLRRRV